MKIDPNGLEVSGFTFWETVIFIAIFLGITVVFYLLTRKITGDEESTLFGGAFAVPIIAIICIVAGMYFVSYRANRELKDIVESRQKAEAEREAADETINQLYSELKKGSAEDQERDKKLDALLSNLRKESAAAAPTPSQTPAVNSVNGDGPEQSVLSRGILITIIVAAFILILTFEVLLIWYLRARTYSNRRLMEELEYLRERR